MIHCGTNNGLSHLIYIYETMILRLLAEVIQSPAQRLKHNWLVIFSLFPLTSESSVFESEANRSIVRLKGQSAPTLKTRPAQPPAIQSINSHLSVQEKHIKQMECKSFLAGVCMQAAYIERKP